MPPDASKPADTGGVIEDVSGLLDVLRDGVNALEWSPDKFKRGIATTFSQAAAALLAITAENARLRERLEAAEREPVEALSEVTTLHFDAQVARQAAESQLSAARQTIERLTEALTPSDETKAAYIGEFHFDHTVWDPEGENEITHRVPVPWTTVKEIMAAIRARAVLSDEETKG